MTHTPAYYAARDYFRRRATEDHFPLTAPIWWMAEYAPFYHAQELRKLAEERPELRDWLMAHLEVKSEMRQDTKGVICNNAGCATNAGVLGRGYCKACFGRMHPNKCFDCKGRGKHFIGATQEVKDCSNCNGTGRLTAQEK